MTIEDERRPEFVFDALWTAILKDPELRRARQRLSLDEIRTFIKHCFAAFSWQPMDTLPEDGGPSADSGERVLAITADGRVVQMRPWMLRETAKTRTPEHLRFPAIGWMHVPPIKRPTPTETSDGR